MDPEIRPAVPGQEPADANGGKTKAHVMMVASPESTHFNILLQILHHLGRKYPGLTVTVVSSEEQTARLKNLRNSLDIRSKAIFRDTEHALIVTKDAKFPTGFAEQIEENRLKGEVLRKELVAHKDAPGSPTCIISSKFNYWSGDWAADLGIPWYPIYPTPFFALLMVEWPKLGDAPLRPDTLSNLIPGVVPTPFFSLLHVRDLRGPFTADRDLVAKMSDRVKRAEAVVVNCSEGLDRQAGTVDGLRTVVHSSKVFTIGPILQYPGFGFSLTDTAAQGYGMDWLDSQRENSVLYIAFGTLASSPTAIILEIAAGIEASGVPFLWVLRLGSRTLTEVLPLGFADRTKGRGRIETSFVPQTEILAHPSIGCFLTHGGWNSLMEALCAGVPVIAWAMGGDQAMNIRFIVGQAKAGHSLNEFKPENKHTFDDIGSRDIEKAVRHVMLEGKDGDVRRNMKTMQEIMRADMAEGGASHRNLHAFLDEIAKP